MEKQDCCLIRVAKADRLLLKRLALLDDNTQIRQFATIVREALLKRGLNPRHGYPISDWRAFNRSESAASG